MLPPSPDDSEQPQFDFYLDDPAADQFPDSPGENGPDALGLYLREIRRTPPLAAEDQTALFQQIERGDGDAEGARHELITRNLRLVVNIAKRYANHGMSLEDVIQEGNIGLIAAVRGFDWRRGVRFSTYATVAIRGAIIAALTNRAHTIRIPDHVFRKTGRIIHEPLSLEAPINIDDSDGLTLGDSIIDENAVSPLEAAVSHSLSGRIAAVLNTLTERERQVLVLRFGLGCGEELTLEVIGPQIGVKGERVRQIEAKALRKLRHPQRSYLLHSFHSQSDNTHRRSF